MLVDRLILILMAYRQQSLFRNPKLLWPAILAFAALDAGGIYLLASDYAADEAARVERLRVAARPPVPKKPPPPTMIHPPAVEAVLRSGTLIVISKKSQNMFVFSDGQLWSSTPISTGKRRHETPSGVFPILQKRRHHRSNIYSNAPMPFMQRLTWDGIALHAGWVPGYAASHGCVRVPRVFAQALFKLTKQSTTTVIIGDDPIETEVQAQQYALTGAGQLPVRSALAPPPDTKPAELAGEATAKLGIALARAIMPAPPPVTPSQASVPPPPPMVPAPPPVVASPASGPRPVPGQTVQLAAAVTQADAEAHWARLLTKHPELGRFQKSVEPATVNARPVYRLRFSGADAKNYCAKLQSAGVSCFGVS